MFKEIAQDVNAALSAPDSTSVVGALPIKKSAIPAEWENDLAPLEGCDFDAWDILRTIFTDDRPRSQCVWDRFWTKFHAEVCDPNGVIQQALQESTKKASEVLAAVVAGLLTGGNVVAAALVATAARVITFILVRMGSQYLCENAPQPSTS